MGRLPCVTPAEAALQAATEAASWQLSRNWAGVCEISWSVSENVAAWLAADPVGTDCARDLVIEACWNAMRHAHANTITVDLELPTPRLLHLIVVDDGEPGEPGAAGLGTQMLNDMTVDWSRGRRGDRTVVRASIPVEPAAPYPPDSR